MKGLLVHWLLSAFSLMIVAYLIPGIEVRGFGTALVASAVIGLLNATIGFVLKILTFPLTILTFGLFWLVINALILEFASWFVPGFIIHRFSAAFFGSIILSLVHMVLHYLVQPS